jgi:hypothetical protein
MSNLLIAMAVFVITVVGALFAIPYFVDWNSYRSTFEEEASRVINREVQVDGDVKLHILPTPYFRLEKVRIAEPASTQTNLTDPFFRADSLSVKLSIPPMFRGIVEANEIEFQRPILRVVQDAKGEWNWQGFARALGGAAYMPANVTLTSLKITDGILALHGTDGQERGRLEGLKGELSAPALDGPYRFRGSFHAGGAERELRLATATPEADGSVRMRASLRFVESGAIYVLDARVAELMGKPSVNGELTARLPIAGLWDSQPAAPKKPSKASKPDEEHDLGSGDAAFDLKANVAADVDGASLSDIALSFEQGGRPQLVTGTLRTSWQKALALDMKLASRWLDLDRITAATEGSAPYTGLAKIAGGLRDVLPAFPSRIAFAVDQANLGGEVIGPVHFSLARSNGPAQIEYLRAGLPGGSRGELKGTISGPSDALEFSGALSVRGTSAARFAAWAMGSGRNEAKDDGAFGLDTTLSVLPGALEAKDFRGSLAGTSLKGSVLYNWSDRPQLAVSVEGPQTDIRALLPKGGSLPGMYALLVQPAAANAPQPRALANVRLDLQTGLLVTADRTYRDVVAKVRMEAGNLKNLQLRLSGDDGYALQLDGNVDDAATRPKGTLHALATAKTAAGLKSLADVLGLPPGLEPDGARADVLVPLRVAGTLTFANRNPASADLAAEGDASGITVKISSRLEGTQGTWKDQTADITIAAEASDSSRLAALVFGSPQAKPAEIVPGRLLVKAAGIPAQGLQAVADIQSAKLDATFRGRVDLAGPRFGVSGDLDLRKADGADIAGLAGLPARPDALPVVAALKLSVGDDKIAISKLQAQVGDAKVTGSLAVSRGPGRRQVEGSLRTDEIALSQLISPLLDHRMAVAGMAQAALSGRQGPWPDLPFGGTTLESLAGAIDVSTGRLSIADGMAVEDASFKMAFTPDKIEVKGLSGRALGGQVAADWTIARIAAGAEVRGKLNLTASLDRLAGKSVSEAPQPVTVGLEFSGKGVSPRGAMSAAQGKGIIEIKDARLAALWPGAIAAAADAAIKAEPDKMGAAIRSAIASTVDAGTIPLGPRTIALDIADGQVRTKPVAIDTRDGRVSGSALLEIATLDFRSQWHLEAPQGKPAAKPLPSVVLDYSGPIAALGTLAPRIESSSLEQELAARKIERDVEELERLRKLDEQRRLMEAERLRRQFDTPPVQRPQLPSTMPAPPPGGSLGLPAPG